jgi:hypothetical protein
VLEGLLEFERATDGTDRSRSARRSGENYLLTRHLFRRASTGQPVADRYLSFLHPGRWRYDVLRALDYFRAASQLTGSRPDPRLDEAMDYLVSKRLEDGRWVLDYQLPGRRWLDMDEEVGMPSRWITLRAMRVLKWWQGG